MKLNIRYRYDKDNNLLPNNIQITQEAIETNPIFRDIMSRIAGEYDDLKEIPA